MQHVYLNGTNIISPLGFTTEANLERVLAGESGVEMIDNPEYYMQPFPAAVIDWKKFHSANVSLKDLPKMEQLFIASIKDALEQTISKLDLNKTLLILSTTKGSIDQLTSFKTASPSSFPAETAKRIARYFGFGPQPIVVSNACISGVLAINMAARLIEQKKYDHVVVSGGDLVTEFVVSGFASLMAIGSAQCKPFDADRDGINLGEACATAVLSGTSDQKNIQVLAGHTSNDANHISGPSRTGDGLLRAIEKTLEDRSIGAADIDVISAHGTATLFNDDMESKAFLQAGLHQTPLNSLKGYFGHTLGAAGVLESIITTEAMVRNVKVKNIGCTKPGTAEQLNILMENQDGPVKTALKTASGFGGCNAAVLFQKNHG